MELTITRNWQKKDYTIGRLFVNGTFFCNTLEPPVIPTQQHPKGCIPRGKYEVSMNIISPKYSKKSAYRWCVGRLPRLQGVPGFDGILIHAGNSVKDTAGCILVGANTVAGGLTGSQSALKSLWTLLEEANRRREEIHITIE